MAIPCDLEAYQLIQMLVNGYFPILTLLSLRNR
jgi:hypothetical protein